MAPAVPEDAAPRVARVTLSETDLAELRSALAESTEVPGAPAARSRKHARAALSTLDEEAVPDPASGDVTFSFPWRSAAFAYRSCAIRAAQLGRNARPPYTPEVALRLSRLHRLAGALATAVAIGCCTEDEIDRELASFDTTAVEPTS